VTSCVALPSTVARRQQGLAIAMKRHDAHVEARPEIGDDALEVLEGHDPSPIDEVMRLIALRAVNAPKVARVGGLDGEEDWWAPDSVPLPQIADAGGGSVEVFQILYDV